MREHARLDGLLGNAAVADDPDGLDDLRLLGESGAGGEGEQQQQNQPGKQKRDPQIAGNNVELDLHRAGVLRRAQVLVRSKVRLHGKNMHTLTA